MTKQTKIDNLCYVVAVSIVIVTLVTFHQLVVVG